MQHNSRTKSVKPMKMAFYPGHRGQVKLATNATFSFFRPPITNNFPAQEITLPQLARIISGTKYKDVTDSVRVLKLQQMESAAKKIKSTKLPYVTFAGVFTARKNDAVIRLSGLMCFDFDHIKNPERLKLQLMDDENIIMMFTSPSGDGLKVIYIDPLEEDDYRGQYEVLKEYFKKEYRIEADKTSDISRACFICHDPEVWCKFKF
jgi:hypothetical protein